MSSSTRSLTLLEQKRIQWAREREEMVGLCGLWGHPKDRAKTREEDAKSEDSHTRKSVLPPIPSRRESEETQKDESETSGYLSDSPKHADAMRDNRWYPKEESTADEATDYGMDRKTYKNYKNEKWARESEPWQQQQQQQHHHNQQTSSKTWWFGTPDSVSSDDGSRLRWGDRGVGIGHLWEPVVHQPDSRLPQVESYRPTPKWVERGLRQSDSKADILIIHHPDDESYKNYSSDGSVAQKNFLLGQNVRLTPDVIEERERRRRRALEHQKAIREQLEDRERKRKEERLKRLREERLEEERIEREKETERLRMAEEERRARERQEKEQRKEEAMREAIEAAERKAREEKKHQRKQMLLQEVVKSPEKKASTTAIVTPRTVRVEETKTRDSSSQFDQVRHTNNGVQFLNNIPMDGGVALVLDNAPTENAAFVLPPEGVQLALLMSPSGSTQLIPIQTPASSSNVTTATTPRGRVLTPSKFRERHTDKTTQTEGMCCGKASTRPLRKSTRRSGRVSGSDSSEKSNSLERRRSHRTCTNPAKHRSRSQPKLALDERPKWGINRPSVQYKKQSEKDLYYQKRLRERMRKTDAATSPKTEPDDEEKPLESEMRLLKCETDEDEPKSVLRNGYRMTSRPSSPMFVPIDSGREIVLEMTIEPGVQAGQGDEGKVAAGEGEEVMPGDDGGANADDDDDAVPGSVSYVTQSQLDAIRQLACLREGLQKLQLEYSSSRSITPRSDGSD